MSKSHYIRTKRSKVPRHPKSEKVPGSFEDSGRWIRCWNCGFMIDLEELRLSGNTGIVIEDAYAPSDPSYYDSPLVSEDTGGDEPLIILKPDGTPETEYYTPRHSYSTAGCPFCGCTNLF